MECKIDPVENNERLTDFIFGSISDSLRHDVESHLVTCQTCLKTFFDLKRDIDLGSRASLRPSVRTRLALHNQARTILKARRFRPSPKLVFAGVAAAATVVLIAMLMKDPSSTAKHPPDHANLEKIIDSGGTNPGHINTL